MFNVKYENCVAAHLLKRRRSAFVNVDKFLKAVLLQFEARRHVSSCGGQTPLFARLAEIANYHH